MQLSRPQIEIILKTIKGVAFDSRIVKKGDLFVALKGETMDGHQFVKQAKAKGAVLFLVEKISKEAPKDKQIVTKDTLKAFHEIAATIREKYASLPVLGITGSVGKTTVKEMCKIILEDTAKGLAPEGSFNNHTGVPLTLSKLTSKDKWAIIEMGMNHKGEISILSKIARPTVCVISQIAPAHIGNLGSLDNIIKAKLEILEGAEKNAPLIVPDNDPKLKTAALKKTKNILTFGRSAKSTCRIIEEKQIGEKLKIKLTLRGKKITLTLNTIGPHNAMNAACAVLATQTLLPKSNPKALEKFKQPPRRLNIKKLKSGITLIDDAYNANPVSMKGALDSLKGFKGKKIGLVVGDMLEMGTHSKKYHTQLGKEIAKIKPVLLIAVGKEAETVAAAAKVKNSFIFKTSEDAGIIDAINASKLDVLLVKGSNGIKLNKVVEKLK